MTCIKMGSDESHFNVSLIVRDKVTRQCPQTTTFLKGKESRSGIEPRSFRLPAYRLTARPNRFSVRYTLRHGPIYTGPSPKALTECSPLYFRRSSILMLMRTGFMLVNSFVLLSRSSASVTTGTQRRGISPIILKENFRVSSW